MFIQSFYGSSGDPLRFNVVHFNYTAYDYYSINEFNQNCPGKQWRSLCLPQECSMWPDKHITPSIPTVSGLAFVTQIYVITGRHLHDRHVHLKKALTHHFIPYESINWRWKWNKTLTQSIGGRKIMFEKMNLVNQEITSDNIKENPHEISNTSETLRESLLSALEKQEAVTIEHVDLWHEIALTNDSFSLVLEDDALFVPFFKQKFNRFVYEAIRKGALKITSRCAFQSSLESSDNRNAWLNQDSILVFGSCFNFHGPLFQMERSDAAPTVSAQKTNASRCTHAYFLTACSAKALVRQIMSKKNKFQQSDYFLRQLVAESPTLQSFCLDPPLVYQGNQAIDLDSIKTFQIRTY